MEHAMKYPALDCTFVIPVQVDHMDRVKNLQVTVEFLTKHFDTNIIVGENSTDGHYKLGWYNEPGHTKLEFAYPVFHRTQMLNDLTRMATTPIVFNWDADVIVPPGQIWEAIVWLRAGRDVVYPFDGTHECVDRKDAIAFWETLDTRALSWCRHRNWDNPTKSVGGCLGYRVASYWAAGGENEHFISYGPEDSERFHRYQVLGLNVARVGGSLYHIEHWKGENSLTTHAHFGANNKEFARIKAMTKEQLQKEISTWSWAK